MQTVLGWKVREKKRALHYFGSKTSLLIIWRDMLDLCTVWMESQLCCTEPRQNKHHTASNDEHGLRLLMQTLDMQRHLLHYLVHFQGMFKWASGKIKKQDGLHFVRGTNTKEHLQEPINHLSSFKNKYQYPLSYLSKSALPTRLCGQ